MNRFRDLTAGVLVGIFLCSIVVGGLVLSAEGAIDRAMGSRHE